MFTDQWATHVKLMNFTIKIYSLTLHQLLTGVANTRYLG